MDNQVMVDAWNALDTKGKGYVSVQDLYMFMKRENYDIQFIQKFMKLFDADDNGYVTLDEYCKVLGISRTQIVSTTRTRVSGGLSLPAGVEFISGDMEISWQIKLSQLCMDGLRSASAVKEVPKWIKKRADDQYGSLWHVVMVNGQFWCYYGHEPGYSFVFSYEKYIFIVWKTPVA